MKLRVILTNIMVFCFLTSIYPQKQIKLGQDTLITITKDQLVEINKVFADWKSLKLENSILDSIILRKDNIIGYQDSILNEQYKMISDYKTIENLNVGIQQSLEKKYKAAKKKTLKYSIGAGLVGILLGSLISIWR